MEAIQNLQDANEATARESYRPRATKYLVRWPNNMVGGFEREDILVIATKENRAEPVSIWKLTCTLPTIYEPTTLGEVREIAFPTPLVSEAAA